MIYEVAFYVTAAVTLAGAAAVALSRNIIYSAFALLISLMGVAVVYALLSDDFLATVQLLLYVGGILVLILFAIMLTWHIDEANRSNECRRPLPAIVGSALLFGVMAGAVVRAPWQHAPAADVFEPAARRMGESLLGAYLLPFEVISVLLLMGLVGAVVIARKEIHSEDD